MFLPALCLSSIPITYASVLVLCCVSTLKVCQVGETLEMVHPYPG
jgi:hypothetical protein